MSSPPLCSGDGLDLAPGVLLLRDVQQGAGGPRLHQEPGPRPLPRVQRQGGTRYIIYTDQVIDIIYYADHWVCAGESSWEGAVHVPEMPLPHRGRASQVPRRGEKIKIYMIEIISNISTSAVLLPVPLQLHGLRHRADEQRAGGEDAPRLHRAGAQRAVLPPLPRQDGHPHLRGLQETHRGGLVKIQSAEK